MSLLLVWRREDFRAGLRLGVLLAVGAAVTIAPWVTYASIEERKFTPITTAGPSSLWVATYLPAEGRQIIVKRQFMDEVCRTFPDRQDSCGVTATQMDMRLIFELLAMRHPGKTQDEAIQAELDRNIREYALGQPVQFGQMLVKKSARIWGRPWGGGAIGRQESSVTQQRLFMGLTLLGALAGLFFAGRRRRYVAIGVLAIFAATALNTIFVSESRMSLRMTPLAFAIGIGGLGAACARVAATMSQWRRSRPRLTTRQATTTSPRRPTSRPTRRRSPPATYRRARRSSRATTPQARPEP